MLWYVPYYNESTRELRVSHKAAEILFRTGRSLQSWMDETLPGTLVALYAEGCGLTHLPPVLPPTLRRLGVDDNDFVKMSLPEGLERLFCSNNETLTTLDPLPSTLQILHCLNCVSLSPPSLPPGLLHILYSRLPAGSPIAAECRDPL